LVPVFKKIVKGAFSIFLIDKYTFYILSNNQMIDPHVHLRDWNQKEKETVKHGLKTACRAGLDAVFDMPNTDPSLTSEPVIKRRLELADSAGSHVFYGLYAGLTKDINQIEEMVRVYNDLYPRVVGFKLFAGKSTGELAVISEDAQRIVFKTLSRQKFKGVIAVHCEKESHMHPELFNPDDPFTHTLARPKKSEIESVRDIIKYAALEGFKGTVHICHVSLSASVDIINNSSVNFRLTCGITPHHLLLNEEMMKSENGYLLKMNPPLRPKCETEKLLSMLLRGDINWIETDHAPHKRKDKRLSSGIPGFPVYPYLIKWLKAKGAPESQINNITHNNITDTFKIEIKNTKNYTNIDLFDEYDVNAYIHCYEIKKILGQ